MRRKLSRYIRSRRLMAGLAALLFVSDLVITMMASNAGWFEANAAKSMSLSSLLVFATLLLHMLTLAYDSRQALFQNGSYNKD